MLPFQHPREPTLQQCATVSLVAPGPNLLWFRRPNDAPSLQGFHVCPGGHLSPHDRHGVHDGGLHPEARVAGLRELFEEAGILWAHGAEHLGPSEQESLRASFHDSEVQGHQHFASLGLRWRTRSLHAIGRWITPDYAPRRFDTFCFALNVPARLEFDADAWEVEAMEWINADDALARWSTGAVLLAPPLVELLRSLQSQRTLCASHLRSTPGANGIAHLAWEFVPGIRMFGVRTPTLPPATHTNSYLLGHGAALLVEPASGDPIENERTLRWIRESAVRPIAIALTHHHADHVGGLRTLREALQVPVWAHEETDRRLPGITIDRHLHDGDVIHIPGPPEMTLDVIHTPGHAPGHVCFLDRASRVMVVGDMVAGQGTILIEPRDGDMEAYLASLARMKNFSPSWLLPAHGFGLAPPLDVLDRYITHRLAREAKVIRALEQTGDFTSVEALVPRAYDDAPPWLWGLATMSTTAHLIKLRNEDRAIYREGRWRIASPPSGTPPKRS